MFCKQCLPESKPISIDGLESFMALESSKAGEIIKQAAGAVDSKVPLWCQCCQEHGSFRKEDYQVCQIKECPSPHQICMACLIPVKWHKSDDYLIACHMCVHGHCPKLTESRKQNPRSIEASKHAFTPVTLKLLDLEWRSRLLHYDGSYETPNTPGGRCALDILKEIQENRNPPDEVVRTILTLEELTITDFTGFLKRLTIAGFTPNLPKYPFMFYFDTTMMRYVSLADATYDHAIRQIPRDGNSLLKVWILAVRDQVDDTMATRRRNGCTIPWFCQRCLSDTAQHKYEMLFCRDCSERIAMEQSGADIEVDWTPEEVADANASEREQRCFGMEDLVDEDGNLPDHDD